jgi:hypothetical protein
MHRVSCEGSLVPGQGRNQSETTRLLPTYAASPSVVAHRNLFGTDLVSSQDLRPLQPSFDSFDQLYGLVDEANHYRTFDSHEIHRSPITSLFNQGSLHGGSNDALANADTQGWGATTWEHDHLQLASSPHMEARGSTLLACTFPPILPLQFLSNSTVDAAAMNASTSERQSQYESFRNLFHTSEEARDYRRRATRFDRVPYCDPTTDTTIAEIEHDRQRHVMRIYNAITSGEDAKDNRGSIAMKRWVLDAHYPADLVEAFAHKVFDCLLAQAKDGFRGWVHNDYVADERKGDDIDKEIDCAGRLENIIVALKEEKTICEDVMNSACQIRMFVNAPRAYANRKHQNRVGNSKRGRTKDTPELDSKAARTSRGRGRRGRTRSSAASDLPSSPGTTLQHQQRAQFASPYYDSSSIQASSLSPMATGYSPSPISPLQQPATMAQRRSFNQRHMPPMAPSPMLLPFSQTPQPYVTRLTTEPLQQRSTLASSPPVFNDNFSAPASPDDAKITTNTNIDTWDHDGNFRTTLYGPGQSRVDPMLPSHTRPYQKGINTIQQQPNTFVNLTDIEGTQQDDTAGDSSFTLSEDWWLSSLDGFEPASANSYQGQS